ncbi:hypothetical protein FKM82_019585 [Ascaphus truei]
MHLFTILFHLSYASNCSAYPYLHPYPAIRCHSADNNCIYTLCHNSCIFIHLHASQACLDTTRMPQLRPCSRKSSKQSRVATPPLVATTTESYLKCTSTASMYL